MDKRPFWKRPIFFIPVILLGLLILLVGVGVFILTHIDFRPLLEKQVTQSLGRTVKLGDLTVKWGYPLHLELRDLSIANAEWGSQPQMISVGLVAADIDVKALWSGNLVYQKLLIRDPVIVLERDKDGRGNWKFSGQSGESGKETSGGFAIIPKNRRQFPIIFDLNLADCKISYRTYSGHVLRIALDQITLKTTGEDQPVKIDGKGAYNDADIALTAITHSYRELHDAAAPFGTTFTLSRKSGELSFDGTMMEPLDFDDVRGRIKGKAERANDILSAFHANLPIDPVVKIEAHLDHEKDDWHLTKATGLLANIDFSGELALKEGSRGQPDDIDTHIALGQVDLDKLLASGPTQKKSSGSLMSTSLETPDKTTPHLALAMTADQVRYSGRTLNDVDLKAHLGPDKIVLDDLKTSFIGMHLRLAASLKPIDAGSAMSLDLSFEKADLQAVLKQLGDATNDLGGQLSGSASIVLRGKTIQDGLKNSRGDAVLAIANGRVSKDLIEKATTDLRNLFHKNAGMTQVNCMIGILHLENGIGKLAPLRMKTPDAVLNGSGSVNLLSQSVDLIFQSDRKSTGFFALDLPIHISGPWEKPSIGLAGKDERVETAAVAAIPASIRKVADVSACKD